MLILDFARILCIVVSSFVFARGADLLRSNIPFEVIVTFGLVVILHETCMDLVVR